ncbi:MAG: hypothetical protein SNJ70_04945 [Armatimonadota bacterium]
MLFFRNLIALSSILFFLSQSSYCNEIYRIRIENTKNGLVQISNNNGVSFHTVGKVTRPASNRITGFPAASYTPEGEVAAVAVHGIRIKIDKMNSGLGKIQNPQIFSIIPKQFEKDPRGFGGHSAGTSGIVTDIPAGQSIFRNFAPLVGSKVYLESDRTLIPMPLNHVPADGSVYEIIVSEPDNKPSYIEIENKIGGLVKCIYDDKKIINIAKVVRPVKGVGRYDGTTFTGVGAINTNHGGVITISTAPICSPSTIEGGEIETRGGFMIQPNRHVKEQGETKPQVMVVAPLDIDKPLEGTAPLFYGNIALRFLENNDRHSYMSKIKIDNGDWEELPALIGKIDNAFTPAYLSQVYSKNGAERDIKIGITHIRISLPDYDKSFWNTELNKYSLDYYKKSKQHTEKVYKGILKLEPSEDLNNIKTIGYYIDGKLIYISNTIPFNFDYDTRKLPNGLHRLEIETYTQNGKKSVESKLMLISN